ncbi:MAG: ankyrin repeat domain-containing protein [Wolbachia sp.]
MHPVFLYDEFNYHDLGDGESPLRKKFVSIVEDLERKGGTHQGSIKLIHGKGGVKYLRAKLSDRDRLLFTSIKYNNEGAFVILEVILSHKYGNSEFLKNKEKIKNIKIVDQNNKEVFDNAGKVKVENAPQVRWLDKFITFSAKQEDIVENAGNLPLIVSGSAGSGKTSVALEKLRKIEEEFKEGKILYITKSENLIKKSKELYEYEYYDEAAKELKVGVPEGIEFLSVHEFIEKVTKEDPEMRKRVKGKRPINRNAFFSWFNKKCKKKEFNEYAKDREEIFEEFIAVIGGGGLLGKEGKDQYVNLGDKQSIFPKEKRKGIYDFFKEYENFIEESSEYYDTSLIAHECVKKVQANYDAVVVDEVQDLTESTLKLILKSLKDESKSNFLLCGDVNQVIHPSFFSVSRLKSFLHKGSGHNKRELQVCTLEKNYRNSKQVIELANRILHFKNCCFASEDKMTAKEKENFFMESGTENKGSVSFIAKGDEQKIAGKISESTNWAVLVLNDESKKDARKSFKTPLVFSIQEAKGLEFENVILYKFTSHEDYNKIWSVACPGKKEIENTISEIRKSYDANSINTSRPKNKEDKSFEKHKFYINALYVAVTRAINNVYIIDDEKKCNLLRVIEPGERGNVNIGDIKKEKFSPEEWRDIALKLIDEGNVEQAKGIAEKLLRKREGGYAKEIMSALKAKEKDHTQESQLPLDKNEQAISELKTENPTQESSMGKSSTPAEKSRKRKGQQNQNEEKKSERLEKNTKELFSALENGDLQKAKKLIKKGVDVNATTSEEGDTPLHVAAYNGYESIAGLLLAHGANVDAKTSEDYTPLHIAAQRDRKDIAKLLLYCGANVDATEGMFKKVCQTEKKVVS